MSSNGINKAIILGRVGKDVDMKYNAGGGAIASFSVATGESWVDKNTGQKQEKTDWHNITIFGKLAEIAGQYVKKGDQIYLEGKNKTEKYTGQDGVEKYSYKIILDSFSGVLQMLGSKQEGQPQQSQPAPQQGYQQPSQQPIQQQQAPTQGQQGPPAGYQNQTGTPPPQQQGATSDFNNSFDDDLPF